MTYTKAQFDSAAERLLGQDRYQRCILSEFTRVDLCREIAFDHLIGGLASTDEEALEIVRATATQLWQGDGTTGLID